MKTKDFDFGIPKEMVAQVPMEPRDHSRLLILHREDGSLDHSNFYKLPEFLSKGDALVFNDSRVIKARVRGIREDNTDVVILLIRPLEGGSWEALVELGTLEPGEKVFFPPAYRLSVLGVGARIGKRKERLIEVGPITDTFLDTVGEAPVPPYIEGYKGDPERYQTVYSRIRGSSAAPTAGLHFTDTLLEKLRSKGIRLCFVTLHVGIDTFMPVYEEDPVDHRMYTEYCYLGEEVEDILHKVKREGKRVIGVGTTSCRTLETASSSGVVRRFSGPTSLYILPGYEWKTVDAMVTNFHYPQSTNLMMTAAFAGYGNVRRAYKEAVKARYRFYSFGDSMLIV